MKELSRFRQFLAEGIIKEDITKLRGQELLDLFNFTKYMNVDLEELESELILALKQISQQLQEMNA